MLRATNGGAGGTAIVAGDVSGNGRAASFYGVTSNDLVRIQNDGSGLAARFSGGVEFNSGVHPAFAYVKADHEGAFISSSSNEGWLLCVWALSRKSHRAIAPPDHRT